MSFDLISKSLDNIESKLLQLPELADRLLTLEQRGALRTFDGGAQNEAAQTVGAEFSDLLQKNRETFNQTRSISLQVSTKGLVSAAQVGARMSMGATPGGGASSTEIAVALQPKPMPGMQSLTYARRGATTEGFNSKPQNGEGAAKQEVTPNYSSVTQSLVTVAGYANLSEQALNSDGELRSAIDLFLSGDVIAGVSSVLASGSTATGATFEGFLALANVINVPITVGGNQFESTIAYSAMQMRQNGYQPTLCVVNPASWGLASLRVGADGHWVNGSPFSTLPMVCSGMRVVFNSAVPDLKALLIDERYAGWGVSDSMRITAAYVNDGFIKNIITLRGEMGVIPFMRDIFSVRLAQRLP